MKSKKRAVLLAISAAALYGMSAPFSKLLLEELSPTLLASLLYIGAGLAAAGIRFAVKSNEKVEMEAKLTAKERPYVLGMILLDIGAPILLMVGLTKATPANVSMLNNFEIVATAVVAMILFKETIGRRMWVAIGLITLGCIVLSLESMAGLQFSLGSLFVLGACVCWGLENNCTRMMSLKNPMSIVLIKGFGSGFGALLIALVIGIGNTSAAYVAFALLLGGVSYGVGIYFYILAQRVLGAARTSAFYAVAPFIGVALSIGMVGQDFTINFILGLVLMVCGAYFAASEDHGHFHLHESVTHEHRHSHGDGHHEHHGDLFPVEHSHLHTHERIEHSHTHTPDLHHQHPHEHRKRKGDENEESGL